VVEKLRYFVFKNKGIFKPLVLKKETVLEVLEVWVQIWKDGFAMEFSPGCKKISAPDCLCQLIFGIGCL
jgi:hypothetical protein